MGTVDGKVALITGAARGLGRAYAKRPAGLGAKVAVADRNLHAYEEFEAEARDMTGENTAAEIEATGSTRSASRLGQCGSAISARRCQSEPDHPSTLDFFWFEALTGQPSQGAAKVSADRNDCSRGIQ
jgi:NAD(P)-dependent dehydrogenase (short-subunit alcohol dehydrogenase family)